MNIKVKALFLYTLFSILIVGLHSHDIHDINESHDNESCTLCLHQASVIGSNKCDIQQTPLITAQTLLAIIQFDYSITYKNYDTQRAPPALS